ncbi:MAG: CDP-glycerol glycerophosphotransferase family protein [Lachnospiraceae bacterium]|nr:CDP-glycerol glycerophosphotransferase family protein [Lachnospiraceae bacterium]
MKKRELWLFSKHGNDTGDNAFAFFKYVRRTHPEIRCVYVADKHCPKEYNAAQAVGEVVQFRSFRHKWLFLTADKIITSHVGDSEPWDYEKVIEWRQKHPGWIRKHKIIHLQHGVIDKNVTHIYDSSLRPVDLFICSTEAEAEYTKKTLHYDDAHVVCTGLARFDNLIEAKPQRKILLIPRYRRDVMVQLPENKVKLKYHFMKSGYYQRYQSLLENEKLAGLLESNGYELIFYPHYEVQPLIGCFHVKSKNITITDRESEELDQLLKDCGLMITDYSSVAFDFAYMSKPVIYYQFDREDFECEYGGSYFDHERDGFGPVANDEEQVVRIVEAFIHGDFDRNGIYKNRCRKTFMHQDGDNCKRIYRAISNM